MDKAEEPIEELKVEEISVDTSVLNLQDISKQIHEIAKDKKVMRERFNAFDLLNGLEGKAVETKGRTESNREER